MRWFSTVSWVHHEKRAATVPCLDVNWYGTMGKNTGGEVGELQLQVSGVRQTSKYCIKLSMVILPGELSTVNVTGSEPCQPPIPTGARLGQQELASTTRQRGRANLWRRGDHQPSPWTGN